VAILANAKDPENRKWNGRGAGRGKREQEQTSTYYLLRIRECAEAGAILSVLQTMKVEYSLNWWNVV